MELWSYGYFTIIHTSLLNLPFLFLLLSQLSFPLFISPPQLPMIELAATGGPATLLCSTLAQAVVPHHSSILYSFLVYTLCLSLPLRTKLQPLYIWDLQWRIPSPTRQSQMNPSDPARHYPLDITLQSSPTLLYWSPEYTAETDKALLNFFTFNGLQKKQQHITLSKC